MVFPDSTGINKKLAWSASFLCGRYHRAHTNNRTAHCLTVRNVALKHKAYASLYYVYLPLIVVVLWRVPEDTQQILHLLCPDGDAVGYGRCAARFMPSSHCCRGLSDFGKLC
jgi:hypothetical protein